MKRLVEKFAALIHVGYENEPIALVIQKTGFQLIEFISKIHNARRQSALCHRRRTPIALTMVGCVAVFSQLVCQTPLKANTSERPNIVMIIADDQAWMDYGFMGNDLVHTPNLDRLASQSARFVNGYVPSSVCRPSLVSILTGLYPHQHGVHFNHGPPGNSGYNRMTSATEYRRVRSREFELIRKQPTLPRVLQKHGYRCLQTGKFWEGHWRNGGFTEGMTVFESPPESQTYGGIRTLASGVRAAHGNGDIGLQIGRETMKPIRQFIASCEGEQTPWMVWYAPYLPHQPHDSPKQFYDLAKSKGSVAEHDLPYFASIAQFDHTVGQLVDIVKSLSDEKNTLFVFVSDNGWRASKNRQKRTKHVEFAHTKRSKRAPFDDGLRTPILVRWDKVVAPSQHDGLVSSIDLMPTILSAVGVSDESSDALSGIDLMPIARGEAEPPTDRAVFGGVYPGDATSLDAPHRDIAYRWIRQGNWKLIVPHSHQNQKPWGDYLSEPALFRIDNDPFEQTNVISEQPTVASRLHSLLDQWWTPYSNANHRVKQ